MLKINTLIRKDYLLVRLEGEFDVHAVEQFRQVIDESIETSEVRNLALSLKGVSFIDSSGVGAILGWYKKIQASNGETILIHLPAQVERVLALSGLTKIMKVYPGEKDAFEAAVGG
ncbi:anti-sigma factor antagonist [Acetonema longum]|uniref:Anti-sigma factor antagonist n=1 Tax=Acetonema longum DSM 6540 TaxID=1009370 RepID=F7NK00_9FIRM|nr:anti-sigma factor antagonist [Acetonema longum]EGO63647.1 anti-sigma-factor antagonist spoIIAA [Acetonema longum DSM 6540]